MISNRAIFFRHIGQTTNDPLAFEIERAEGIYLYDSAGKDYIDLVSGVSVSNVGHRHPRVVDAVKDQVDRHMHLLVYGELVQYPQVNFARLLLEQLPQGFDNIYYVNSGSEANEGALKLAKKYTGRTEIVGCKNAYHGSTHGALSLMGNEKYRNPFRPLIPDVRYITFNKEEDLEQITRRTACVMVEPVQAEAGIVLPRKDYLQKLRDKCNETGALLIFDEVQTGFGRTGSLFGMTRFGVYPDIFTIAKGMGGGMPIGAFVSSKTIMDTLKAQAGLGHITTFGGHPVSAAAAHASLQMILEEKLVDKVSKKGRKYMESLKHPGIKDIWGTGLFIAIELKDAATVSRALKKLAEHGIITDQFIFKPEAFRIAPPLTITEEEIETSIYRIKKSLDAL
ncbi:MAG: aspartate aminotransferase family protein [Bacteroidota bacterium]